MRLRRRGELVLDPDVELPPVGQREPRAAARRERRRLLDLLQPEQLAEERARRRLAAGRRGDLHMVEADDPHASRSSIERVATPPQLEDTLIQGYTHLASGAERRRIDVELRILDIVLALVFGLLALPLAALIALAIALTDGRPVLYRARASAAPGGSSRSTSSG